MRSIEDVEDPTARFGKPKGAIGSTMSARMQERRRKAWRNVQSKQYTLETRDRFLIQWLQFTWFVLKVAISIAIIITILGVCIGITRNVGLQNTQTVIRESPQETPTARIIGPTEAFTIKERDTAIQKSRKIGIYPSWDGMITTQTIEVEAT